jgi:hypothetical protein
VKEMHGLACRMVVPELIVARPEKYKLRFGSGNSHTVVEATRVIKR